MKWEVLGPKSAFGGKWDPKPSIFLRFKATSREGAPKGAFARKVALFAKKLQNGGMPPFSWNFAKFSENGPFSRKGSPAATEFSAPYVGRRHTQTEFGDLQDRSSTDTHGRAGDPP